LTEGASRTACVATLLSHSPFDAATMLFEVAHGAKGQGEMPKSARGRAYFALFVLALYLSSMC
jgi:hypothetical protein